MKPENALHYAGQGVYTERFDFGECTGLTVAEVARDRPEYLRQCLTLPADLTWRTRPRLYLAVLHAMRKWIAQEIVSTMLVIECEGDTWPEGDR